MKVLVTGASGNVGRYVVEQLLKMGDSIIVAGTDPRKLLKMFGEEVEVVELDFTKPETFEAALCNIDRIFLMRPPHLGDPAALYPFLDVVQGLPIKLISFLSFMGVEKNTIPPHHKIEKYIERLGIPFSHIRPGFFMQNISGIHSEEIRLKDTIFVPAGKSKTSFIDASDIALAIATVLHEPEQHRNSAYTITGPEALDYNQVAEILSKVTKRLITYSNPGFLSYRSHYINGRGLDKKYVHVTMALYFMTRLGTAKEVTETFYRLTGRKPKSFETFAMENAKSFAVDT